MCRDGAVKPHNSYNTSHNTSHNTSYNTSYNNSYTIPLSVKQHNTIATQCHSEVYNTLLRSPLQLALLPSWGLHNAIVDCPKELQCNSEVSEESHNTMLRFAPTATIACWVELSNGERESKAPGPHPTIHTYNTLMCSKGEHYHTLRGNPKVTSNHSSSNSNSDSTLGGKAKDWSESLNITIILQKHWFPEIFLKI